MDKFPVIWKGKSVGELVLEAEKLYTWFAVRCCVPEGLWCAWVVGKNGELRLGVLEPAAGEFVIRRRYSEQMAAPMGQVLRGEIRPALKEKERWERLLDSERQIRTSWLRKQIRGQKDMLIRKNKASTSLAIPYDKENPFPIPALFCFAEIRIISDRSYVVIAFDEAERPVFPRGKEEQT